jgi:hypothetical protein
MKNAPSTPVFRGKQRTKSLKAGAYRVNHGAGGNQTVKKTLVRFFVSAVMVGGMVLGLPTSGHAQSAQFDISAVPVNGAPRESLPQVIRVTNVGGAEATGITVTLWPPKGAKIDAACQVDHLPGGSRSYTCLLPNLGPGDWADVPFSISMTKSGDIDVVIQVTSDQASRGALLPITII